MQALNRRHAALCKWAYMGICRLKPLSWSAAYQPHQGARHPGLQSLASADSMSTGTSHQSDAPPGQAGSPHSQPGLDLQDPRDLPSELPSSSQRAAAITQLLAREDLDGGLYVVATPLGNLSDITLRALTILKSVNAVLAEDTRRSAKLLNYYGIRVPELLSCHEHNEFRHVGRVLGRLKAGEPIALVSDAGTPGISDPGALLISAAVDAGIPIISVPGPCAAIAALVPSGLSTTTFTFVGFLPSKTGARRAQLAGLSSAPQTLIFYAPPHGLCAILEDMAQVLGASRRVCVARELTKLHEELLRGTLADALRHFQAQEPRGELVVLVEGASPLSTAGPASAPAPAEAQAPVDPLQQVTQLTQSGMPLSAAVREAAAKLGISRKDLYSAVQAQQRKKDAGQAGQ